MRARISALAMSLVALAVPTAACQPDSFQAGTETKVEDAGEGTKAKAPAKAPPSTPPSDLDKALPEAAQAFFDGVVVAYKDHNTDALWKLADKTACEACRKYQNSVESDKKKGLRYESEPWRVENTKVTRRGGTPEMTYSLTTGGGKVVKASSGDVVETVKPKTTKHRMVFREGKGAWLIVDDVVE